MFMKEALLAVLLVGCGGGDDGPPTGPVTIGSEGGKLGSVDRVLELVIPAGAVAEDTVFEITLSSAPAEVPAAEVVGNVYDLQPEGTTFAVPARLTWTYATTPANATGAMGQKVLFESSVSEAGVIETAARTETDVRLDGSLVVTNEIAHLSSHLVTGIAVNNGVLHEFPIGFATAELRGGEHFVDTPWSAGSVTFSSNLVATQQLEAEPRGAGPVVPLNDPSDWNNPLLFFDLGYKGEFTLDETIDVPATMPRWQCTDVGSGKVKLAYAAAVTNEGFATTLVGVVLFEEEVTCVIREEKPEYLAERATLTEARVETALVPTTVMKDLATVQGSFGYFIHIDPGQTVEACVSTTGSAAVNYFPHFPPGFVFVDTTPGCTNITSADPELPNDVLVVVTGSGTITVTTRVIP